MNRISTIAFLLLPVLLQAQSPWPSESWNAATNLTAVMDADGINDLSGLHWNPVTNRLYCVQGDGRLHVLQLDTATNTFSQIANKSVPDGPEGVTQVNFSANEFYTIDENNYEIRKFTHNATFGNMTEAKHWNLLQSPSPMQDTGNTGPEGIVFVPDSFLTAIGFVSQATGLPYASVKGMGGLMLIAHQDEGYIWAFDVNPNVTNDFAYVGKYKTNRLESCDLAFDRTTGLLYILHNIDANYLETTDLSSVATSGSERKFVTHNEYFLGNPSVNINTEGFALMPKCPDSGTTGAWICRDVEPGEGSAILQDALRWFSPFAADGSCAPLSVGESMASQIAVYPNPGNDHFTIAASASDILSIDVTNILGQHVLEQKQILGAIDTGTSAWASGLYFIEVELNGKKSVKKWIKT